MRSEWTGQSRSGSRLASVSTSPSQSLRPFPLGLGDDVALPLLDIDSLGEGDSEALGLGVLLRDAVPLRDSLTLEERLGDGLSDIESLGLELDDGDMLGVRDSVPVGDREGVMLAERVDGPVSLGLSLGVGVSEIERVVAPVSLGLGDDVALPLAEADSLGDVECVWLSDGVDDTVSDTVNDGLADKLPDALGDSVGVVDTDRLGELLGEWVSLKEWDRLRDGVALSLTLVVEDGDGVSLGDKVSVGMSVADSESVSDGVALKEGDPVGVALELPDGLGDADIVGLALSL